MNINRTVRSRTKLTTLAGENFAALWKWKTLLSEHSDTYCSTQKGKKTMWNKTKHKKLQCKIQRNFAFAYTDWLWATTVWKFIRRLFLHFSSYRAYFIRYAIRRGDLLFSLLRFFCFLSPLCSWLMCNAFNTSSSFCLKTYFFFRHIFFFVCCLLDCAGWRRWRVALI